MTTEYRLERKELGGWKTVSWWSENELDKATVSYNNCSKQADMHGDWFD